MMEVVDLDIPDFLKAMRDEYEGDPRYQRVYRALVDGRIPGRRYLGKWRLPPESKVAAAKLFGLKKRTQPTDVAA